VFYDGPSAKARKLSVLSQGYPVEILVTLDAWLKVRDASGELAWIEAKELVGASHGDGQGAEGRGPSVAG
jgi:SH3-like domain-containing protein